MFDKYFEKRRKTKEIREKFLTEHDLPDRAPGSNMPLKWDINIEQIDDEYKLTISQHNPTRGQVYKYKDHNVYKYNIKEKKLEIEEGHEWRLPEYDLGKFW